MPPSSQTNSKPKHWLNRNIFGMGMASTLMPEDQHGAGFGLMSTVDGVGDFLSSVTMDVLWTTVSPNAGLAAAGILAFFSAGLLQMLVFAKGAGGAASNERETGL